MTAAALTLTDFLLARIAEDEAHNADSHRSDAWHELGCAIHPQGLEETWCSCHTPARVLAECAAKRAIVARHTSCDDASFGDASSCPDMRDLAAVYADHPDFQEEWRA